MKPVEIYTTGFCGYCVHAKSLLDRKNIEYLEIRVDRDPERRQEMLTRSQRRSVPQIFIGGESIGGCEDLYALEHAGALDRLLG